MILKVRTCRKCGCKSTDNKFLVRKNGRRENICIPCHRDNYKDWYENNRQYCHDRVAKWKKDNPELSTAINKRKWRKKKTLLCGIYGE